MNVHDAGQGFSFWTPAVNSELYGNLIYYNGFDLPDRGHGHGIYAQNDTGTKTIAENIIFDQYGWGIHIYTEGGSINNFNVDGNISFNNGSVSFSGYTNNILVGGLQVANNNNITNNYTYYTPAAGSGYNNIGYSAGCSNTTINNNYFASGYFAISLPNCVPTQMTGNTFYGLTPGWISGAYSNNVITGTRPTGVKYFVRPNKYEPGRGNITIFNWASQSTVSVDLSPLGLSQGAPFEIRDAENFSGPPVASGTYTGAPVLIPMVGLLKQRPVGNVDTVPPHTAPEFGVFVVLPISGGGSAVFVGVDPPTATLTAGQTQQFTATVTGASNTAVSWSVSPQVGSISSSGLYMAPSPIASVQTVTVKATSAADSTRFATASISLQPPPTSTAQFVSTDTTTKGTWTSVYGSDGFNVIGDTASYPAYAVVAPSGQSSWTWASSTSDVRALQKRNAVDRIAATWFSTSTYSIDVYLTDGQNHKVAIYGVDWDSRGRAQTVDVLDAGTGIVLDTRSMSNFVNGQYLVWNLSGHVVLRVTHNAGINAVLSGLFFGSSGAGSTPPPVIPPPTVPPVIVPASGHFLTAYALSGPATRNNFSGWVGMKLTLGTSSLNVSSAGRMCVAGNSGLHSLKFVNATTGNDVPGGSASINMAGCTSGQFVYAPLQGSPVTLQANTSYYLVSQEVNGGDLWYDYGTVSSTNVATVNSSVYSSTGGSWTTTGPANSSYVPVDFQYAMALITGYNLNNRPLRNDFNSWVGMKFTVGGNSLLAATLGRICVAGNIGTHQIKFVDASTGLDVPGGSVSLNMSGCSAGQFFYGALASPITLQPHASYYLVSQESVGGDQWYDYATIASSADAAVNSSIYFSGSAWIAAGSANSSYVPPNFQYSVGQPDNALVTGYTVTNRPLRNNVSGWVGMKFTAGPSGMTVSSLGRLFVAGNSGTHTIKLVRASDGTDVPGASVALSMAGGSAGLFSYASLASPITLQPNTAYYLVSQETLGGDQWYDYGAISTTSAATVNNAVYSANGAWFLVGGPNQSYVPPNLK
jgi:hypothetical protein